MFSWRATTLWLVAVFTVQFCTLLSSSNAAGPTYKQYNFNLKADLLVLDVGGLQTLGNHPMGPLITSPQGCQGFCDGLPGCTGWTFCKKKDGCGSGCKNYAAKNPTPGGYTGTGPLNPNTKLPIKWFGPLSGQMKKCTNDRWAFGVCSLKRPANPSKPEFWSRNTAEGWVSGVVILPAECKGLSATTCRACAASKNPSACRACATSASKYSKGLFSVLSGYDPLSGEKLQATWTEGCAACAALPTSQRLTCSKCLSGGNACAGCVVKRFGLPSTGFFDTASCLSCASKNPAVFDECANCAAVKDAAKRSRCESCVSELKSFLVQDLSSGVNKYKIARGDFCRNCVSSNTVDIANKCIACGKAMPDNDDCYECSLFNGWLSNTRATCYECATKAQLGKDKDDSSPRNIEFGSCSRCFGTGSDYYIPDADKPTCKACLYDPNVPSVRKYWCNSCVEKLPGQTAAVNTCISCLKKSDIADYYSQCVLEN